MGQTLTIRLEPGTREILEEEAQRQGKGLSAFIRQMAEAEAKRLRKERIKAEGQKIVDYLKEHPEAGKELEDWGTPDWDCLGEW